MSRPLPQEVASLVAEHILPDNRLHLWSVRNSAPTIQYWRSIAPGDWFLFYQMGFITIAARASTALDSQALAAVVWGRDQGEALRYMVVFGETRPVWAKVWPFREELGARFLGFRRVSPSRLDVVRQRFGSVETFVATQIVPSKRPPR
jgi:hypothetical protein